MVDATHNLRLKINTANRFDPDFLIEILGIGLCLIFSLSS